jgi:hypothetical protein
MKINLLTKFFAFILFLFFVNTFIIAQNARPQAVVKLNNPSVYTLPIGTVIRVRMDSDISSKNATVGDTFTTTVIGPVFVRNVEIIPAETVFEGKITKVVRATKKGGAGVLGVKFETIRFPNKETRQIDGQIITLKDEEEIAQESVEGNDAKLETATMIGGGAGAGALIGGMIDGRTGALIGAVIGAGAGGIGALANKGNEAVIKANTEIGVKLNKEVSLPVKDY